MRSDSPLSPATSYDCLAGENRDQVLSASAIHRCRSDLRLINNPIEVIRRIHGGEGAVVAFQHKDEDGRWLDTAAIKINELPTMWPKLVGRAVVYNKTSTDQYLAFREVKPGREAL